MYNILKLNNFRRFKDFSMELKPVSLIGGINNIGKTTILESVFLLHDYMDSNVFLKLLGFRGIRVSDVAPQNIWEPLFYEMDSGKTLKIEMDDKFSLCLGKNNRYTLPKDMPNDLKNKIVRPNLSCGRNFCEWKKFKSCTPTALSMEQLYL